MAHPVRLTDSIFLSFSIALYALSGYFTKLGSCYIFLSTAFLLCLGGAITILAVYAILWQIALKRVPLSQAYPFRSLGVVYGLAIAYFAFHEDVTWQNLIGAIIVLSGLLIITTGK